MLDISTATIIAEYAYATTSSMWCTIITLITLGVCLLIISHIPKRSKRKIWQIGVAGLLCILFLSINNLAVTNPNAIAGCRYNMYERYYNHHNAQHNITTHHFSISHINDDNTNSDYFNHAIINSPHDNKVPTIHFWNYL